MARKTRALRVSYRESSSDSDGEVDHDELALRASRTARPRRAPVRPSYQEPESDVEAVSEDEQERLPKRRRLSLQSPPARVTRSKDVQPSPARSRARSKASNTAASPRKTPKKRLVLGAPKPAKKVKEAAVNAVPTDGRIMPWATLPYEILVSIFEYASASDGSHNGGWLVRTALVCKAFCEPALTALYRQPPLTTLSQPHELLDTLRSRETLFDYKQKIRSLRLDARHTLQYTLPNRGLISLTDLVACMPLLQDVDISEWNDRPPYRSDSASSYAYPDDLLESLNAINVHLRHWRWNGSMIKEDTIHMLAGAHSTPAFATLRSLTVSHVDLQTTKSSRRSDGRVVDTLAPASKHARFADTICALTNLRDLSLESIAAGDFDDYGQWDWLVLLPKTLMSLKIINAPYLDAETFADFLGTHGHHLHHLDVSHNQLLDLSFLTSLGNSCPTLQTLRMDCTYYSPHALNRDSDPLYDELLTAEDVPTWPSTLQHLELLQLRKWDSDAASCLFTSLIDAAASLKDLRRIAIKANLNISWRERAGFRDTWIHRMQSVFLDDTRPPDARLASMRVYREWQAQAPTRSKLSSDARSITTRATAEDEFLLGRHRQARCSLVDINIDNLRPTEHQFTEQDFVDSEVSGDDDWQGDADVSSPPRYAW